MKYWKKLNTDGTISTVESHSFPHKVPDAVRITKEEYDAFIASLPIIEPEPIRDLEAEMDELKLLITGPEFHPKNPVLGVEQRLLHVEDFLRGLYPLSE